MQFVITFPDDLCQKYNIDEDYIKDTIFSKVGNCNCFTEIFDKAKFTEEQKRDTDRLFCEPFRNIKVIK